MPKSTSPKQKPVLHEPTLQKPSKVETKIYCDTMIRLMLEAQFQMGRIRELQGNREGVAYKANEARLKTFKRNLKRTIAELCR